MTTDTDQLGLDLARELADGNADGPPPVDPRTIPSRFSLLKTMALSAAHYHAAAQRPQDSSLSAKLGKLAPGNNGSDPSLPLRFGSAAHYMLLGQPTQVATWTGGKRQGRAWEDFKTACADSGFDVIVNMREYALVRAVTDSIRRHERAMELLFDGSSAVIEQRIDWRYLGKPFRSTPDTRSRSLNYLADLKTTVSSEPRRFHWHSLRFFYHVQAALYGMALEATEGWTPRDCFVVAVEKTPPFCVTIFRYTDEALLVGRKLVRLWTEQLLSCERANVWPGYASSDVELDVPREGDSDDAPDLVFAEVG